MITNYKTFFRKELILLSCILCIGASFRLYGINWDQGFHLHPDERAIILYTLPLAFPSSIDLFFSPTSPLNPHFFAYGNFPLYLLKAVGGLLGGINPWIATYDGLAIVGRSISVIADLVTIVVIYGIGKLLQNRRLGLIASFLYALSVFPIQAAHFYAVDTLLTCFITITIYQLLRFSQTPSKKRAIGIGLFLGLSLVTKISALVLVVAIGTVLIIDFLLLFLRQPHKPYVYFPHIPRFLKRLFVEGFLIVLTTGTVFAVLQPYALIDWKSFVDQNLVQSQMSYDPFIFPYTLQYVGKIPYLYELKNIFFFGLGPPLTTLAFCGFLFFLIRRIKQKQNLTVLIIYLSFFLVYFMIVGKFAVGWIRYMLPLYPYFAIFAAFGLYFIVKQMQQKKLLFIILNSLFLILFLIWPVSFLHIYTQPNTRVLASQWINTTIPAGKTLAIEHWDDGLPLFGQEKYRIETLELYNYDSEEKWQRINEQLQRSDYIILASNRLYTPLQKLTDCQKLPPGKCYPRTAQYYKDLFAGNLEFKKVKEFVSFPTFGIGDLKFEINDEGADEAFTVYDHPKVIIFQKI